MTTTDKTQKVDDKSAVRTPQQGQQMQQAPPPRQGTLALEASRSLSPFGLVRRLFEDLERLSGTGRPKEVGRLGGALFVPEVEIMRRGDKLVVLVDLPGLAPADVQITTDNGILTIEGERRSEHESNEGAVWTCERTYGRFQRVIALPKNADLDNIEARFENGVLEISIPAPEQRTQGKQVEIKQGSRSERPSQPGSH